MLTVKPDVVVLFPWGKEIVRGRYVDLFCKAAVLRARENIRRPKRKLFWFGYTCPECGANLHRIKFRMQVGVGIVGTPVIDCSIWECACGYEYARTKYHVIPIGDIF